MPIAARAKMSHRFLLLAAAALAAVGISACDSSSGPTGTADKETRQVTVVGAGQVQGAPDTLTVNASIEFVAPDVSGAMNQTSDRQKAVIDALVGFGIDREDISTTQVSLQPQFAGGDATRINSVNYSIEDDSQLVKDARARAFNDAKDRAQQYAQLSGLSLGKVVSITESGGATPPPSPMPYSRGGAEMAAVPVEPGQQTVGFSVTVIFELT